MTREATPDNKTGRAHTASTVREAAGFAVCFDDFRDNAGVEDELKRLQVAMRFEPRDKLILKYSHD